METETKDYFYGYCFNDIQARCPTTTISEHLFSEIQRNPPYKYAVTSSLTNYKTITLNEEFASYSPQSPKHFFRGYFERHCECSLEDNGTFICKLDTPNLDVASMLQHMVEFPSRLALHYLIWEGVNAVDLIHDIYEGANLYDKSAYRRFCRSITKYNYSSFPVLKYTKTLVEGVPPKKDRFTDSGFDLCLVKKLEEKDGVVIYDTGISVQPPFGYYFELVARSSIWKSGWMLANNIGIIDAGYNGSITVALVKTHPKAHPPKLPARLVQLIPRKLALMEVEEVETLLETHRGNRGGLGSIHFSREAEWEVVKK